MRKSRSRTKQSVLERLPYGALEDHIKGVLALFEAGCSELFVALLPKHMQRPNILTSIRYQTGKLVAYGTLVRVMSDAFVAKGSTATWRTLFKIAKPDLYNIVSVLGEDLMSFERLCYVLRNDCDLTAKQVGDGLRKLKSLELVAKSGKSHWRCTYKLDRSCLQR